METKSEFKYDAKSIPTKSGCYLFFDDEDKILYIGKAKNLRKRVSSYFQKKDRSPKLESLTKKIAKIETRIVNSETEALILENNLIKKLYPPYNVLLRGDNTFSYLRITNEDFPRLEITRKIVRDGSFYLGPKTSSKRFRETLNFCQKIFGVRTCRLEIRENSDKKVEILKNPERKNIPCMDAHIGKCCGVCTGKISREKYLEKISEMKKFLKGNTREVLKKLEKQMFEFASQKKFEAAGKIRDLIKSISATTQKQIVEFTNNLNADFINFFREKNIFYLVRIIYRQGKFVDMNEVKFSAQEFETDVEILAKSLLQFYEQADELPAQIFLPIEIENKNVVEKILLETLQTASSPDKKYNDQLSIQIDIPQKGDKLKILNLAKINAKNFAKKSEISFLVEKEFNENALPELAKILQLKDFPRRIECYDISHFGGHQTVGSQIVFIDGKPKKSEYRRYKIKNLSSGEIDDYAALAEVISRRFRKVETFDNASLLNEKFMKHNQKVLKDLKKIREILGDTDFWLFGGLGCAFAVGSFWREHNDIDILIQKKDFEKIREILEKKKFLFNEEAENKFSFTRSDFTKIEIAFFNQKLNIGQFTKKDVDEEEKELENVKMKTLKITKLLKFKNTLKSIREKEIDQMDIDMLTRKSREISGENIPQFPDLIVIDGGRGQLSAVTKMIKSMETETQALASLAVISLAKENEEIFIPNQSKPINLPETSVALKLLQQCRDEAHRFAISFNRNIREKNLQKSVLDEVRGIGTNTKKKLLKHFGSVSEIRKASDEILANFLNKSQLEELRKML